MGNSKSKDSKDPKHHAEKIKDFLRFLGTNIEGLTHTVQTQRAYVEQLLLQIYKISPENGTGKEHVNHEDKENRVCIHCTYDWQQSTRRILGSTQASLECQSDSLLTSFKALNRKVNDIITKYKLDSGTSVDNTVEMKPLHYDNARKMDDSKYIELLKTYGIELYELNLKNKSLMKEKNQLEEISDREKKHLKEKDELLQKIQDEVQSLITEKEALEKKLKEAECSKECDSMTIAKLETDKENLMHGLNRLKESRPVPVQLYFQAKGDIMNNLLIELKGLLVDQMGLKRHRLQSIVCHDERDVDSDLPLLVLCINASRLGTDAVTALQKIKVSSKVSVLVFHHRDIHALPNQPSCRVLTGPEFKALGGIFDIAFLTEKGIYPCDMNKTAAADIANFLRSNC